MLHWAMCVYNGLSERAPIPAWTTQWLLGTAAGRRISIESVRGRVIIFFAHRSALVLRTDFV